MAASKIQKLFDRVVDRAADILFGPMVALPSVPAASPQRAAGDAPVEPGSRHPGSGGNQHSPGARSGDSTIKGTRGLTDHQRPANPHADNCIYTGDTGHECTTPYGEPARAGQDCYPSARAESLRSFAERHPMWKEALS